MLMIVFVLSTSIQAATPDLKESPRMLDTDVGIKAEKVVKNEYGITSNRIEFQLERFRQADLMILSEIDVKIYPNDTKVLQKQINTNIRKVFSISEFYRKPRDCFRCRN
mgnify:FL=1